MTEREVKIDRRGRIVDLRTGQPFRNRDLRNYKGAFMGQDGTAPTNERLEARQKAYDDWAKSKANTRSRRRPGSNKR